MTSQRDYSIPVGERVHGNGQEHGLLELRDSDWSSFTNRISLVKRVLGDTIPQAHVKTKVAPRLRSSYQADRVVKEEVDGLPLAGVVRSAVQLVEFNIREQCHKTPYGSYRNDWFPLKLREASSSRKYYRPMSTDFQYDTSVVDPELSGLGGRELRVEHRVVKNIEEISRFSLAALSTLDHLLATISSIIKSVRDINQDVEVPAVEKVGVIESICDSATQLLDSVGTCVCDMAKSSATLLGQTTMIRREHVLQQIGGLSSSLSQELREAPLLWPGEREVEGDQPLYLFRGKAAKIEEDRRKEAQRLSFESMAQSQRKRPPPRQDAYATSKKPRVDTFVRPAQEQPRRDGRGGSGGRSSCGVSRSGTGQSGCSFG